MRILVVEDSPMLATQISEALVESGYVAELSNNGRDALYQGQEENFDAVILDLGLPEIDGLTVLSQWRTSGKTMPVLILTARDNWHEKVAGIDAGADDYLTKPFHMEELLARIRALIRRTHGHASAQIEYGPITLDTRQGRVTVGGRTLNLTSHEYRLLAYLMHHPDKVISRTELTEHLYAQDFERDSNTIEVFVARLRKKLPPNMIETQRGLGYRLINPA